VLGLVFDIFINEWKREVTKFNKYTKLLKAVRMMEELQGSWAIKWHLKMSADKMLSDLLSKTSHSFMCEVMGPALVEPQIHPRDKILGSDRQGQESVNSVVVRNASQMSSVMRDRVEHKVRNFLCSFINLIQLRLVCSVQFWLA